MEEPKLIMELMARAGSDNPAVSGPAMQQLARALETPIKEAIFPGDIFSDLFTVENRKPTEDVRYPTDLINPGAEKDFSAYAVPAHGRPGERLVEPDYIRVPTFEIEDTIELPLKAVEQSDYNLVARALQVLEAGLVMKMNDDCFRCIIKAGYDRNKMIYDALYAPGYISKRFFGLMQIWMRRYAGGNYSSVNRFRLKRMYMSPEARASMLDWTNATVDEVTRRELVMNEEGQVAKFMDVELRTLDELGAGNKYQNYYSNTLGGSLSTYTRGSSETKTELVIGIDSNRRDRFVMPVKKKPQVWEDGTYHRRNLASFYTRLEYGVGLLDGRCALLGNL